MSAPADARGRRAGGAPGRRRAGSAGTVLLALAALVLLALDGAAIHLLRRNGVPLRFVEVTAAELDRAGRDGAPLVSAPDSAYLASLAVAGGVPASARGAPLVRAVLRWTMDQASAVGDGSPRVRASARDHLAHAHAGGGLSCAHMADVFVQALRGFGVEARRVALAATLDPRALAAGIPGHTTVEVLLDGRWVVFDPTFHVSYRRDGRLLGAAEVRAALLAGEAAHVEPVFHGPVAYPARLETYPVSWTQLYRHVMIVRENDRTSLWTDLPPQRWWVGPRFLHAADPDARLMGALYFTAVVVLPLLLAAAGLLLLRRGLAAAACPGSGAN